MGTHDALEEKPGCQDRARIETLSPNIFSYVLCLDTAEICSW